MFKQIITKSKLYYNQLLQRSMINQFETSVFGGTGVKQSQVLGNW